MVLTINRYYATLRTLDKKGLIVGASEKNGNMPFRTVYSISEKGKEELRDTLTKSILSLENLTISNVMHGIGSKSILTMIPICFL